MLQRLLAALLLAVFSLLQLVVAVAVRGQIQPNEQLPDLMQLGAGTQVVLRRVPVSSAAATQAADSTLADTYRTFVKRDGSFLFYNVTGGAYTLTVQARWHAFKTYRVDVTPSTPAAPPAADQDASQDGTPAVRATNFRSASKSPVKIRAHLP